MQLAQTRSLHHICTLIISHRPERALNLIQSLIEQGLRSAQLIILESYCAHELEGDNAALKTIQRRQKEWNIKSEVLQAAKGQYKAEVKDWHDAAHYMIKAVEDFEIEPRLIDPNAATEGYLLPLLTELYQSQDCLKHHLPTTDHPVFLTHLIDLQSIAKLNRLTEEYYTLEKRRVQKSRFLEKCGQLTHQRPPKPKAKIVSDHQQNQQKASSKQLQHGGSTKKIFHSAHQDCETPVSSTSYIDRLRLAPINLQVLRSQKPALSGISIRETPATVLKEKLQPINALIYSNSVRVTSSTNPPVFPAKNPYVSLHERYIHLKNECMLQHQSALSQTVGSFAKWLWQKRCGGMIGKENDWDVVEHIEETRKSIKEVIEQFDPLAPRKNFFRVSVKANQHKGPKGSLHD